MAEKSKISNTAMGVNRVAEMLANLKKQLFDILLFTKSVRKVNAEYQIFDLLYLLPIDTISQIFEIFQSLCAM